MEADFFLFIAVGLLAQMVGGTFGMAFDVICSSSLIALGLPPAIASASISAAEVVKTGISGGSHICHRNVDKSLFLKIVVTGVLGGLAGAYILTGLPEASLKVFVAVYLTGMALLIISRVLGRTRKGLKPPPQVLGLGGGFPGCRRRWRLGTDRGVVPRRHRRRASPGDRVREPCGVLRHHGDLGDFPVPPGPSGSTHWL